MPQSDPCVIMDLPQFQQALERWDVPYDGSARRSPPNGQPHRQVPDGFYPMGNNSLNDVSVFVSKKGYRTPLNSTFVKSLLCVEWWQARDMTDNSDNLQVLPKTQQVCEAPTGRRRRRRSKNSFLSSLRRRKKKDNDKKHDPEDDPEDDVPIKYLLTEQLTKGDGLTIPLDSKTCSKAFRHEVITEQRKQLCASLGVAHEQCTDHFIYKSDTQAAAPLTCAKFRCKSTPLFKCKIRRTTTRTLPDGSRSTQTHTYTVENRCEEPQDSPELEQAIMRKCHAAGFQKSSKCCSRTRAELSEGLTEAQKRSEQDQFVQF